MPQNTDKTIVVVGAGIVGLSCALWLQKKNFKIILIDPKSPGSGASSGNACTIADYGCIPVNSPDLFRRLPSLLFSRESPLSLDPIYALKNSSWMIKFLVNCRQQKVDRISHLLGKLLSKTYEGLNPLLDMANARDLLKQQGCMYLYQRQCEFDADKTSNQTRRDLGASFVELNRNEIHDLEPGIEMSFAKGLLFEQASQVTNPLSLCQRYFECFQRQQGQFSPQTVRSVRHGLDSVQVELDDGSLLDAHRVVITAGAFSRFISDIGMQSIPLDTERGYHIQFNNRQQLLSRPVSWNRYGFYATPTDQGLRFAGTIEIAGYGNNKNPRNLNLLRKKAQQMFHINDPVDQEWLGYRPTLPDALPVIGFSSTSEHILFAFGHHHIGLTLAGITGKLIAELVNSEKPSHDITPFSPRRFL